MAPSATSTATMVETNDPIKLVAASASPDQPTFEGSTQDQHGVKITMQSFPNPRKFTDKLEEREYLKGRLALAFRIFGRNGYDEGVAGHITLRDPVLPGHFWVNPFGTPFSHIKKSDLLLVDHEGNVVDGGKNRLLNIAAYMIHAAVHEARPDVLCAAHCHSRYGRTFSTLGREIDISTQDSCVFYKDHAVYNSFKGVVLAKEEGENIARAIGPKKAVILQNHGLLTVSSTVEGCIYNFVTLEGLCHTQLLADAAIAGRGGQSILVDEEDAEFSFKSVGTPRAVWFAGLPAFEVAEREAGPEVYE